MPRILDPSRRRDRESASKRRSRVAGGRQPGRGGRARGGAIFARERHRARSPGRARRRYSGVGRRCGLRSGLCARPHRRRAPGSAPPRRSPPPHGTQCGDHLRSALGGAVRPGCGGGADGRLPGRGLPAGCTSRGGRRWSERRARRARRHRGACASDPALPGARPPRRAGQRAAAARHGGGARSLRIGAQRGGAVSPAAVVTGGSGGIGTAIVGELRAKGWTVTSLSRSEGCDVSDEKQVRAAFARLDSLDALINGAAVLIKRPVTELTAEDWDVQLGAGLRGAFLCSREAFRLMRDRGGSIVMISSLSGVAGAEKFPGMAASVAPKSGLAGLTEALAAEGRELGIRVNAISPGAVDTPMLRIAGVEGLVLGPADVARVAVWLASPDSAPLSGANVRMDPPYKAL